MRRRHDRSGPAERDRTAPLQRPARRTATPWVTVAAGAGAVTLVVAVAGMVGAATGGGEAVVVGGVSAEGGANGEDTVPAYSHLRAHESGRAVGCGRREGQRR
uniref:hypothetical protein n=1 Tax=uncultured Cellulosimicrobium sp. TaxID=307826 RepID=UPI00259AA889